MTLTIRLLITGLVALFGLMFGSFLNIYLTHWPADEVIVGPRAHCRKCGHVLAWWERIPVLSWALLRGRCRACKAWVGWRYPLVELGVGGCWAASAWTACGEFLKLERTPFSMYDAVAFALVKMTLCWLLIALAVLDTEHHWLPDWITLGGAALGLVVSAARFIVSFFYWTALPLHWSMETGLEGHGAEVYDAMLHWLAAIVFAPLVILLIRRIYHWLRKHDGVKMGEAKLMLLMAAWLGLSHTVLAFCLAVLMGVFIALVVLMTPSLRRATDVWHLTKLRLGTLLIMGSILSALWGRQIIDAYIDLLRSY